MPTFREYIENGKSFYIVDSENSKGRLLSKDFNGGEYDFLVIMKEAGFSIPNETLENMLNVFCIDNTSLVEQENHQGLNYVPFSGIDEVFLNKEVIQIFP